MSDWQVFKECFSAIWIFAFIFSLLIFFLNWIDSDPSRKDVLKKICIERKLKEACEAL